MIKDKEALEVLIKQGRKFTYQPFYGGKDSTDINLCFSNFYPSEFSYHYNGKDYKFTCNEQFFMWCKAEYFYDTETAEKILNHSYDPLLYKNLGRLVKNYDDSKWVEVRDDYMLEGLSLKFSQNFNLKRYMVNTKDKILVECNPRDKIWSCGLSKKQEYNDVSKWTGANRLGFLIMSLRDTIKDNYR